MISGAPFPLVGAIEAFAHPPKGVQRLLKVAQGWADQLLTGPTPPPTSCRIAYQLQATAIDDLVAQYKAGATVRQLAAKFGVHRATVGKHLEARGVDTRQLLLSPEAVKEAVGQYQAGAVLEDLAMRYHVSDTTIRRYLLLNDVKLRPRGRVSPSL
jgi:DNA-binding transcriptional ArsR family regulator